MQTKELDEAKLKAYEAETAKNIAEKIKIEKETKEIEERIKATFLGISFSSYLKTIMAGIVAGVLIWALTVDYPGKILSAHKNIVEINELKESTAKDLEKVETAKKQVEIELQDVEKTKKKVEVELQQVEIKKKNVEEASEKVEKKKAELEKEAEELEQYNIALRKESQKFLADKEAELREDTGIESNSKTEKLVEQVHDIENRQSNLPILKTSSQSVAHVESNLKTGWVYLGEFDNGQWVKRHFNVSKTQNPRELNGKMIQLISKSINVRTKILTGDVVKILKSGEKVKIKNVKNFTLTHYIWAEIEL
jgi:hypothetical protein